MSAIALSATIDRFPTAGSWTISRGSVTEVVVVTAQARLGDAVGRGECRPYARYDEFPEGVVADIEAIALDDEADVPALHGWRRDVYGEAALRLKRGEIALKLKKDAVEIIES